MARKKLLIIIILICLAIVITISISMKQHNVEYSSYAKTPTDPKINIQLVVDALGMNEYLTVYRNIYDEIDALNLKQKDLENKERGRSIK